MIAGRARADTVTVHGGLEVVEFDVISATCPARFLLIEQHEAMLLDRKGHVVEEMPWQRIHHIGVEWRKHFLVRWLQLPWLEVDSHDTRWRLRPRAVFSPYRLEQDAHTMLRVLLERAPHAGTSTN